MEVGPVIADPVVVDGLATRRQDHVRLRDISMRVGPGEAVGLLGAPGATSYVEGLGLPADAFYNAIKAVGNYGEIFDRHLGSQSVFQMERGLNAQYYDGGLIYGFPFN